MATRKRRKTAKWGAAGKISVLVAALLLAASIAVSFLNGTINIEAVSSWLGLDSGTGASVSNQSGLSSDADVQVHFIDVGQGDCTYIKAYDVHILVDAGETESNTDVAAYLQGLGVEKLDYVIGTHGHSDHIGGLPAVLEAIPTEQIILPQLLDTVVPTTRVYETLLTTIQEQEIPLLAAQNVVEAIDLGNGCTLELLGPVKDYEELNNTSVPVRFTGNGLSVLLCGDMEKEAENDLLDTGINLRANVFKANHHGSSTSNTKKFLEAVRADCFVFFVGKDNSYNHPTDSVLKRVYEYGKPCYRTDYNGTIIFEFLPDDGGIRVLTEKG